MRHSCGWDIQVRKFITGAWEKMECQILEDTCRGHITEVWEVNEGEERRES